MMRVGSNQFGWQDMENPQPLPVQEETVEVDYFASTGNKQPDDDMKSFKEAMEKKGLKDKDVQAALAQYMSWQKKNPNADVGAQLMARRAAVLRAYWKDVTSGSKFVTPESLQKIADDPSRPAYLRDAARHFAHPGNFARLDQAGTHVTNPLDGHASESNVEDFLSNLSGEARDVTLQFQDQVDAQIRLNLEKSGVKLSEEDRKKILKDPGSFSEEQRALVLLELEQARARLSTLTDRGYGARSSSVLKNLEDEIKKLSSDPKVMAKRNKLQLDAANHVLAADPQLKATLEKRYADRVREIESGSAFKWNKDKSDSDNLAAMLKLDGEAQYLGEVLGKEGYRGKLVEAQSKGLKAFLEKNPELKTRLEKRFEDKKAEISSGKNLKWDSAQQLPENIRNWLDHDPEALQLGAVLGKGIDQLGFGEGLKKANGGKYYDEAVTYFKDHIASGKRLDALIESAPGADEQSKRAAGAYKYGTEVNDLGLVLGKEIVDDKARAEARVRIAGATLPSLKLADLQAAIADADGNIDQKKLSDIYDEISRANPDALRGPDGAKFSKSQFVSAISELWAVVRESAKTQGTNIDLAKLTKTEGFATWLNKGWGHLGMGLLGCVALGVTTEAGGKPLARAIGEGVVAVSDVLEGGARLYNKYHPDNVHGNSGGSGAERFFKGAGAVGNAFLGVLSFLDADAAFARGDNVQGGLSLTSGILSVVDAGLTMAEVFIPTSTMLRCAVGFSGAIGGLFAIGTIAYSYIDNAISEDRAQKEIKGTLGRYGIGLAPDEGAEKNAQRAEEKEQAAGLNAMGPEAGSSSGPRGGSGMQE